MLSEEQIAALPLPLVKHFRNLETSIIEKICERLGKIGSLNATDIQKLHELQNIGYDLQAIQKEIADTLDKSYGEIYDIFSAASEIEYENGAKAYFDLTGNKFTPFNQNTQLQNLVESIRRSTYGLFENISATKAIGLTDRFGQFNLLGESYQGAVDYAILQVRTGQSNFYSVMRQTVKSFADNGLTHVEYETGYRRRIDSSVRQAILGGQKELSKRQAEMIGEQIGANGWEITWHSGYRTSPPAPRAHDFGGKQFTFGEFAKQDIGGMMDEYNCYHRKFPIIVGVSKPAYSPEQLAELNAAENTTHNWNGKDYNRYEATQKQRQYETAIRRKKDEAMYNENMAKGHLAAGGSKDDDLYKQYKEQATLAKAKSQAINQEYSRFSQAMGISTQPKRATVSGYNGNYSKKLLTDMQNRGIIKSGGGNMKDFKIGYTKENTIIIDIKNIDFADKIKVMSAINDFADKYKYADAEHALEISPLGKAYTLKGIKVNVNVEILGKDILHGSISIHNHPVPHGEIMGDSFGKQDLAYATKYQTGKQHLVSGERRNAFEYKGINNANEIIKMYDKAYNILLKKSIDEKVVIIWEQEQSLKILSEILRGFEFYENF